MKGRAAIIGGGIGGLAAAGHLGAHGWEVVVHERATDLPHTGTALGLWPGALKALDQLGIGAPARALGRRQTGGVFLRPDGSRIATIDVGRMERRAGDPVYLLSRPPLLRLLAGTVADGVIRFGSEVTGLGGLTRYDVVIAADGINSTARVAVFGAGHQARYVGATAWRGTVDGDVGTLSETWGEGSRFGITPQEGGHVNWYACVRQPEGQRSADGEVHALKQHFGHWHHDVRRVLANLTEETVLHHDLYELAPALPSFVRGNVALIGDAAHAMTPDLGRGACEALIDGVTVARCLESEPTVEKALARYDALRRPVTQRMARMSRLVNRLAHSRRMTRLRDSGVRVALALGSPP